MVNKNFVHRALFINLGFILLLLSGAFSINRENSEEDKAYVNQSLQNPLQTSNKTPQKKQVYKIGDFAQGGIIFWVDETGTKGLVCAKEDQSASIIWAYSFIDNHANADGIYAGKTNTQTIISAQEAAGDTAIMYAARLCNELVITESNKTYDDWYLPSREEINLMWQQRYLINRVAVQHGGKPFTNKAFYWSSNEYTDNLAWLQLFYSINQHYYFKSDRARVRAIRAF
ncbi:MAG: DUF1566 domain-containing protein [Cyclobacteriaceae bacterium]|nr:DUF1566 domain-containing protein [Cyclobacteriaceae bacterium]